MAIMAFWNNFWYISAISEHFSVVLRPENVICPLNYKKLYLIDKNFASILEKSSRNSVSYGNYEIIIHRRLPLKNGIHVEK